MFYMTDYTQSIEEAHEREIQNILTNSMVGKLSQSRKNKLLTKTQMNLGKKFNDHMITEGFKITTRKFYLQTYRNFVVFVKKDKPKEIKKKDIDNFLLSRKDMARSSIYSIQLFLRFFFRWVYNSKEPAIIKNINPKKDRNGTVIPEEILNPNEIKSMAQITDSIRNSAIIQSLYESACRESEFLSRKIKHLTFDKYGAVLIVEGKTGRRRIRLINSVPSLIKWLNNHPESNNPEAPLWLNLWNNKDKPFGVSGLKRLLKIASERANIKKSVYPHLLRHSRLTELAKDLSEQELKMFAGWSPESNMARVYVHLSGKDIDDKLLSIAGKKDIKESEEDKKLKEALKPQVCSRCEKVNSPEAKFCEACSMALDLKTAMFLDEKKESIDNIMVETFNDLKKNENQTFKILMKALGNRLYDKEVLGYDR